MPPLVMVAEATDDVEATDEYQAALDAVKRRVDPAADAASNVPLHDVNVANGKFSSFAK